MEDDYCLKRVNGNDCGSIKKNEKYLENINNVQFNLDAYKKIIPNGVIPKDTIEYLYKALEKLNEITHEIKFDKVFHVGGFGELMVCSILKMQMLSGTTTRGPDAVFLNDSELWSELKAGRYQIKYRDDETSDVEFRVDLDENGKLDSNYAWDYLLIATHKTRKEEGKTTKNEYSIKPDTFYVIPFECAIRLSEDLNGNDSIKQSDKGKNKYRKFRINWTFDRKSGKGNLGRKKECIQRNFELELKDEELEFHDVRLVERQKS